MSLEIHRPERRRIREIPLAPILDLLVVTIFFLILSSTFAEFTKQTVPPSVTTLAPVADTRENPPLNPKLLVGASGPSLRLLLTWTGREPGQLERRVPRSRSFSQGLIDQAASLARELKIRFPSQSNLQIGLSRDVSYQELISVMDGAQEYIAGIVFISDRDTEALLADSGQGGSP